MRILVHVHTWNDADVIATVLDAVSRQTRPVKEILVVDNGSTDGTAELAHPPSVTVIRHAANLGTSGAVETGLQYALARGYDWLWILDADSVPRPDALELLTRLVEEENAGNLGAVCASHNLLALGQMLRGRVLTPGGPRLPPPHALAARVPPRGAPRLPPPHDGRTVECNSIIWSGALINLSVIAKVGLP